MFSSPRRKFLFTTCVAATAEGRFGWRSMDSNLITNGMNQTLSELFSGHIVKICCTISSKCVPQFLRNFNIFQNCFLKCICWEFAYSRQSVTSTSYIEAFVVRFQKLFYLFRRLHQSSLKYCNFSFTIIRV